MQFIKTASLILYHGSPSGDIAEDFANYSGSLIWLTPDPIIAKQYAVGDVLSTGKVPDTANKSPTLYKLEVSPSKILDFKSQEVRTQYETLRKQIQVDPDDQLPKLTTEGFLGRTGYPNYREARRILGLMAPFGYDAVWADEGSQGKSLAITKEVKVRVLEKMSFSQPKLSYRQH